VRVLPAAVCGDGELGPRGLAAGDHGLGEQGARGVVVAHENLDEVVHDLGVGDLLLLAFGHAPSGVEVVHAGGIEPTVRDEGDLASFLDERRDRRQAESVEVEEEAMCDVTPGEYVTSQQLKGRLMRASYRL